MKTSKSVVWLSWLIAGLALLAASIGLFWRDGGSSFPFTTLRGETVQMYGQGLYRYESVSMAAQVRAGDLVTLVLGIPLLVASTLFYQHGSLRGALLLTGTLGYFLYTYASMSMLAAYNSLFLVYVVVFSTSLFAFVLAFRSIDLESLPEHFSLRLPHRGIAAFLFVVGLFLLVAWLGLIGGPLIQGAAPAVLESYTTLVIQALDLGVIVPVAFLAGTLLLRRTPMGYLLASVILMKLLTMGTAVSAMVVGQLLAGIPLSIAEIVAFPLLTLVGIGVTVVLLRNISDTAPVQAVHA